MGGNRHKQEHGKWQVDIKNIVHEDGQKWGKGEGILEILKTPLAKVRSSLATRTCFEQECGSGTSRGVFLPTYFMILGKPSRCSLCPLSPGWG